MMQGDIAQAYSFMSINYLTVPGLVLEQATLISTRTAKIPLVIVSA